MAMLLDEVPRWLKERGYGEPFAVTGVSMGGFGSLLYARRRAERGDPIAAAAVISPGLITTWPEMAKRRAFKNEGEWTSLDPLRHIRSTGPTALGVWIGDRDRFVKGTRRYIREDVRPEVRTRWKRRRPRRRAVRKVTPDVVQFLASPQARRLDPHRGRPGPVQPLHPVLLVTSTRTVSAGEPVLLLLTAINASSRCPVYSLCSSSSTKDSQPG